MLTVCNGEELSIWPHRGRKDKEVLVDVMMRKEDRSAGNCSGPFLPSMYRFIPEEDKSLPVVGAFN